MECAACNRAGNYTFCEECLAWLMKGETEMLSLDDSNIDPDTDDEGSDT
jgi:hypothetical protein